MEDVDKLLIYRLLFSDYIDLREHFRFGNTFYRTIFNFRGVSKHSYSITSINVKIKRRKSAKGNEIIYIAQGNSKRQFNSE